jgi:hypothetical protein
METVRLDGDNRLLVDSLSYTPPAPDYKGVLNWKRGAFSRLALPSLSPGPVCRYNWVWGDEPRVPETADSCRAALGTVSISAYFSAIDRRKEPKLADADAKFRIQNTSVLKGTAHETLFGWAEPKVTKLSYGVFSTPGGELVGDIPLPPRQDSFKMAITSANGQEYLLMVVNGTDLIVYELRD